MRELFELTADKVMCGCVCVYCVCIQCKMLSKSDLSSCWTVAIRFIMSMCASRLAILHKGETEQWFCVINSNNLWFWICLELWIWVERNPYVNKFNGTTGNCILWNCNMLSGLTNYQLFAPMSVCLSLNVHINLIDTNAQMGICMWNYFIERLMVCGFNWFQTEATLEVIFAIAKLFNNRRVVY